MKEKIYKLGWVIAVASIAIMATMGFQDNATKLGVVDVASILEKSDLGKANQDGFNQMKAAREGVLEFMDTYRVLSTEQATKFRDLSIKTNPTAAEKAELERIKAEVIASAKKNQELSTKPNLQPEERTLMQEYASRSASVDDMARRWLREFTTELQQWADKQKSVSIDKARAAIQEVAKAQGYTMVFELGVAPYGANDITDAALKAMNAKK